MIEDLSPLSQCPDLVELNISRLPLIKDLSFLEKGFTKLKWIDINDLLSVDDLSPLSKLQNLEGLNCWGIPSTTSLLPLERCRGLRKVRCSSNAVDLAELRERRPDINVDFSI